MIDMDMGNKQGLDALDRKIDLTLAEITAATLLAGEISVKDAMRTIEAEWNEITEELDLDALLEDEPTPAAGAIHSLPSGASCRPQMCICWPSGRPESWRKKSRHCPSSTYPRPSCPTAAEARLTVSS